MANEEQLSILKQGVHVWNEWREENANLAVDLSKADFSHADFNGINLNDADLSHAMFISTYLVRADLVAANLKHSNLSGADLRQANLGKADLTGAGLIKADLREAAVSEANLSSTDLRGADLQGAHLGGTNLVGAHLQGCKFNNTRVGVTIFGFSDMSKAVGLEDVFHIVPSSISTDAFTLSKGKIPEVFLRGCGLSDWEIEQVKLYDPGLSNEDITNIQYKMYDLRATQAIQISPLYISYSHADSSFVDKLEIHLKGKGVRFWRDIHGLKAGRMEKQFDRAMRQNPTVVLILSSNSIKSDWVEHEVRMARGLEKEMERDVLCPVALDDSWKTSPWPKRVMEQIMEYNILDFSAWKDDVKFEGMFRKLIDGLELFYKG